MGKEIECLTRFGLTNQEANVYLCLLSKGKLTGYEVAKITGISRSNVYAGLANLIDKGAAFCEEESQAKKYIPLPIEEFCSNYLRHLEEDHQWLVANVIAQKKETEGYITVEGQEHMLNKIKNLLQTVEARVYVSASRKKIKDIEPELKALLERGIKVVILTDGEIELGEALVYDTGDRGQQIGVIIDSEYVFTGEYSKDGNSTGLYSGQKNFVELYKRALSNEIKLCKYERGEK